MHDKAEMEFCFATRCRSSDLVSSDVDENHERTCADRSERFFLYRSLSRRFSPLLSHFRSRQGQRSRSD